MNTPLDPNDPNTWPVVDAVPSDVFLGEFVHDCMSQLTDEQKSWPIVRHEPTDVYLESVDQPRPVPGNADLTRPPDTPDTPPLSSTPREQPIPPARPPLK